MQVTIARQLGLDSSTVSNFFMNARRRSIDKWREDSPSPPASTTRTVYVTSSGASVLGSGHVSPSTIVHQLNNASSGGADPSLVNQLDL